MTIKTKSVLRGSSILLIAGVCGFFVTKRLFSQSSQAYTQEVYESSTNLPTKHLYYAVRRDGSTATGSPDPNTPQIRRLRLVPQRQKVSVSDLLKTKSSLQFPSDHPVAISQVTDKCGSAGLTLGAFAGEENIGGITTFSYTRTVKQSDSEIVTTNYWLAPALDCGVLNLVAEKKDDKGVTRNRFERKTVNITFGEPAPTLFQVPSDYAEVSPSEQERLLLSDLGRRAGEQATDSSIVPPHVQATWDRLDELYKKHQQYNTTR